MNKHDGATIEIVNWDKYNPRTDAKRPNWFRFENTVATGPGFHGLDCEQKWLWVVVMSLVSQKNGEPIQWNSGYIQAITGIRPNKQEQTVDIYEKYGRLRVSRDVTSSNIFCSPATDNTDGRTDVHNEQHIRASFDFEILYQNYPRKIGKQKGIEKCRSQIKSQEDFQLLGTAVARYRRYVVNQGIEEKYIKHFPTFMSEWRDWLDPNAGKSVTNEPVHQVRVHPPEEISREATPDPERIREILSGIGKAVPT